jgi:hypothetical protein
MSAHLWNNLVNIGGIEMKIFIVSFVGSLLGCFFIACSGSEDCTPKTCTDLGKQCGTWDDGCGGSITCDSCPQNESCNEGQCEFVCLDCQGCCTATSCEQGVQNHACGTDGEPCQECNSDEICMNGDCVPNNCLDCEGCCSENMCLVGDSINACGSDGETCTVCAPNNKCEDGSCQPIFFEPITYSGGKVDGNDWWFSITDLSGHIGCALGDHYEIEPVADAKQLGIYLPYAIKKDFMDYTVFATGHYNISEYCSVYHYSWHGVCAGYRVWENGELVHQEYALDGVITVSSDKVEVYLVFPYDVIYETSYSVGDVHSSAEHNFLSCFE